MRPVARADVVGRAGVEPACGREDAISDPDADARLLPAEDEWLIEGIRETATGTQLTLRIRRKRIVRHEQCRRRGNPGAAENLCMADPHERIQVDHHGAGSGGLELTVRSL